MACLVTRSIYGRLGASRALPNGQTRCTFLLPGVASSTSRYSATMSATVPTKSLLKCECGCAGTFSIQEGE